MNDWQSLSGTCSEKKNEGIKNRYHFLPEMEIIYALRSCRSAALLSLTMSNRPSILFDALCYCLSAVIPRQSRDSTPRVSTRATYEQILDRSFIPWCSNKRSVFKQVISILRPVEAIGRSNAIVRGDVCWRNDNCIFKLLLEIIGMFVENRKHMLQNH